MAFPLFTAVSLVCRECLSSRGGDLPHVARSIDEYVDTLSLKWTVATGYAYAPSLRLLKFLAAREPADLDASYKWSILNDAAATAAAKGHVEALKWLVECYCPDQFLTKTVTAAATGGYLDLLKWLHCDHRELCYWGGMEMGAAIWKQDVAVIEWLKTHAEPHSECAAKLMLVAAAQGDQRLVEWIHRLYGLGADRAKRTAQDKYHWHLAKWVLLHCTLEDRSVNFDRAAGDGCFWFLEWAVDAGLGGPGDRTVGVAADHGRLEIVQWLHDDLGERRMGAAFEKAAQNGDLTMLKWLHERGCEGCTTSAMDGAARKGFLEVVKWLHSNRSEGCTKAAMDRAAQNGHLDVVAWLHEHRTEGCTTQAMDKAAGFGFLDVVKWLDSHRTEGCTFAAMDSAGENGHLDVVVWLSANRTEACTTTAMDTSAARGNFAMVRWLHEHRQEGCSVAAMDRAAANGHLDVVKFLNENRNEGCTDAAMHRAAVGGFFEVVKYLDEHRSEGCTAATMDMAASRGQLEIVQFLHLNRHEGCSTEAMDAAAGRGHLEVVKFLHHERREGCTTRAMDSACSAGHLDVVRWLHQHRTEGCSPAAVKDAVSRGNFEIVMYLHAERPCDFRFPPACILSAARLEIMDWLLRHCQHQLGGCEFLADRSNWRLNEWLRHRGFRFVSQNDSLVCWTWVEASSARLGDVNREI
jgi:ankyrin repeat protein